jgi:hypothetical protein
MQEKKNVSTNRVSTTDPEEPYLLKNKFFMKQLELILYGLCESDKICKTALPV